MEFKNLDAAIKKYVPGDMIPGCDILVYHKGELVYRKQYGYQDYLRQEPLGTEVYYPIYSCSKVITCCAMMHLIEEGKAKLDDPVSKYIPAFADLKLKDGTSCKNQLTLRHCFTMTGGLDYNLKEPHLQEAIRKNPHATTVELAEAIAKRPLLFEPGTHYQYSLCHDVLAAVAEVITGKSFEEYVREWCFEPLGLKHISYNFNEENCQNMVAQYRYNDVEKELKPEGGSCAYIFTDRYYSGGAGVITRAEDYAKILNALCLGTKGGLLKSETIELMKENQLSGVALDEFRGSEFSKPYGYGLGVRTMMEPEAAGTKAPVGEFGWSGAAASHAIIDTENELAVFYALCVLGCPLSRPFRMVVRDALYEDLFGNEETTK